VSWSPSLTRIRHTPIFTGVCGPARWAQSPISCCTHSKTATKSLEGPGFGLCFPIPGMLMKQWYAAIIPGELLDIRNGYAQAMIAAQKARSIET